MRKIVTLFASAAMLAGTVAFVGCEKKETAPMTPADTTGTETPAPDTTGTEMPGEPGAATTAPAGAAATQPAAPGAAH